MIFVLLYLIELVLLVQWERRIWGTFFTPFCFLAVPTSIIIAIAIIASFLISDYRAFYFPSLIVWCVGLFVFSIPSWICYSKNGWQSNNVDYTSLDNSRRGRITYKIICCFSALLLIFAFLKMPSGGTSWGSDEFSEAYSSNGMLLNHINVFISVVLSYFIYVANKKQKLTYLMIFLCLIDMYAIGVKSWIIAPCIIGYFARLITKKSKFNYKSFIVIGIAGILVFALSYIILMIGTGKSELNEGFITFLVNHFISYITGAPLTFSLDYQMGILEPEMFESLFAPLVNISHLIFGGDPVVHINPTWISFGSHESNVRTFIGTVFAFSHSWIGFILVTAIFSLYCYILFIYSRNSKNPFIILANCTNMGFLTLGFFEFYWLNLAPYEMVVMLLILAFFYKYWPVRGNHHAKIA